MRWRRGCITFVAAVSAIATACGSEPTAFDVDQVNETTSEPDLAFVIPAGAGDALDAGTPLEFLPAELDVKVGDVLEIVNEDDRGHLVGPFFVGANETLTQRFASPGEYTGECSVHPSGEIRVVVT